METRANYILIGAFTLLGILGTLGMFVWLGSVQISRQYDVYGVRFEDVSGLDASGDVMFNGIPVGRVISLRIDDQDPSKVFVTIEVDATTPVRENTVAQLTSMGVTGVAYISLAGGSADAPPLTAPPGELPIIPSRRSTVQALVEDAPDLLTEATELLRRLQDLAGPDNQAHVASILRNLDATSGNLDKALEDFSEISGTVRAATDQITRFTDRLDTLAEATRTTLGNTDKALSSATGAFDEASEVLASSKSMIASAGRTFAQIETLVQDKVPAIVEQISGAASGLNTAIADLSERSGRALDGFTRTADLTNARLTQLDGTLTDATTAFTAVTDASNSVYELMTEDGAWLVGESRKVLADARAALATIGTVIDRDVPAVVADIRTAVASASGAVDRVAEDLTGLTGRLEPLAGDAQTALTEATDLFQRAGRSLASLNETMDAAGRALDSADAAFGTATGLMQTDIRPVLGEVSGAARKLAEDLPAITADLRGLIGRAADVVGRIDRAVSDAAPGLGSFAGTGLTELTRLAAEARGLVGTLNDLVRRIDRDPARFLLDGRVPEYRR